MFLECILLSCSLSPLLMFILHSSTSSPIIFSLYSLQSSFDPIISLNVLSARSPYIFVFNHWLSFLSYNAYFICLQEPPYLLFLLLLSLLYGHSFLVSFVENFTLSWSLSIGIFQSLVLGPSQFSICIFFPDVLIQSFSL